MLAMVVADLCDLLALEVLAHQLVDLTTYDRLTTLQSVIETYRSRMVLAFESLSQWVACGQVLTSVELSAYVDDTDVSDAEAALD
jgi:hypothetical protein